MPEYSTNPSTTKARLRKMNLSGAKKVEDAARTADYKAMLYARKTVQQKPSYASASDSEKSAMLEEAMRDTMEKRRARGQDTMSKMAAFRAGTYRDREGVTGPQTRVPISAFLQDNGFVPSRPSRAPQQRAATAGPSNSGHLANGLPTPANGQGVKASITPGPFAISPEPMLASMEGDGNESLGRLQIEVGHLRTICQNAMAANSNIRELDLRNVQAGMGIEKGRVGDLEVRVSQLEGVVHALNNTSLGSIVDRVNELEAIVEDLKNKVGSGCDAEVAKMREVMGALKSGLDKVGGF
ncbi:hypothetical protein INS49_003292 [Diaporthe citri]|uniref:uncharacterized protein n=1 Tax=Diaporthe citri TaxID=83186 RepID=UPI001C7EAE07|nr:uncharacterized protein INS49_003292 [Diaporthe citri]KAG6355331.1 hypothetical protein INS49_003292 [Diaporthe citri]